MVIDLEAEINDKGNGTSAIGGAIDIINLD